MASKKNKSGNCTFCPHIGPLTNDDIPPKGLFPKPLPKLIKVPSCLKCNNGSNLDDEYFRLMLLAHNGVSSNPEALKVISSVRRSLKYSSKFRNKFYATIRPSVVGAIGNAFAVLPAHKLDQERVDRTVTKIVKGLYFHHSGLKLSDDYDAVVFSMTYHQKASQFLGDLMLFYEPMKEQARHILMNRVFHYWHTVPNPTLPTRSLWIMTFYDLVEYVGATLPKSDAQNFNTAKFSQIVLW